jgi:transcriptional regulator with XRE-family HTH domain
MTNGVNETGSLAVRLYRMRKAAGLTGDQLSERLGWGPTGRTKISKIENGKQQPTADDITAWATACGHPETTEDLLDQLAETKMAHVNWRRRLRHGQTPILEGIDKRTRDAGHIRNVEVAVVPGLLQTAGYARGIINQVSRIYGTTDVDAAVQARMRRQEILYDGAKVFEFVFTEAALHLLPCPPDVMAGQLDRLISMDLPNVTIGITPMGRELSWLPFNSFLMLDDTLVVESYGGKYDGADEQTSAMHERIFDELMADAATGQDARRMIMAAAAKLRQG